MLRVILIAAFAAMSFAQTPPEAEKPPAEVDEALRARVKEFYQYHVTEEYRKAEKLVAEESQDIYYVASKPKYLSFELKSITYYDNFTRAKAILMCEQYIRALGFEGKPMKVPSQSTWKIVDGKWVWYVDKEELSKGPLGLPSNAASKPRNTSPPPNTENIPTTYDFALGQVKFEKAEVVLKPNETQQVVIVNKSAGGVSLTVAQVLPGIEVTIDKANLKGGENGVVTLKANENPHAGVIAFRVIPTQEIIGFRVKR